MYPNKRIQKYCEQYEELLSFNGLSWWVIDLEHNSNIFYCNLTMCKKFELDTSVVQHSVIETCPIAGDYNKNIAIKDSKQAKKIFEDYARLCQGKIEEYSNHFPYYDTRSGSTYHFSSRAKAAVRDDNGNAVVLVGIIEQETISEKLYLQATTDSLTGLKNRRKFDEHLQFLISMARRESRYLSLLLCDIDHFKEYNDLSGHFNGDLCLKKVADSIISMCQRSVEMAFRYGGEEFAVLSYGNKGSAAKLAENIRINLLDKKIPHPKLSEEYVSISIGYVSIIPHKNLTAKELIEYADKALYEAKYNGRNCCVEHKLNKAYYSSHGT
ncbi:MAG: GGDEF domain-containing protein [Colwellia sp.]|nr:GGDEF domain-containing protein [Colwellia sp.]